MTSHADLSDPIDDDDRQPVEDDALPPGGLPDFLTVVEAARVLRIGRTSAYQLAKQWCYTDGREGLPVVRVGRLLRVPRHALERLACGDLSTTPPSPSPPEPPPSPTSPSRDETSRQATPLPHSRSTASTMSARRRHRDDHGTQASLFRPDR